MRTTLVAFAISCLFWAGPAKAQSAGESGVVRPVRIDTAPRIDGLLDEALWAEIEPITDFRQWEPDNGAPPTERTEVRICYDDRYLYVGVRAYDSEPDQIIARSFERDRQIDQDDSIYIDIDSLNDNRNAVGFGTNVIGTKSDYELSEDRTINMAWDTIWYTEANVDELGYTLEIAIPFFSLRFQPDDEIEMGVNIERYIRRKNERANWPYMSRDYDYYSISQYARMTGLQGIQRGVNLEIKPYGVGGYSQVPEERGWDADAGLDVKWGITPNLTADLTLNPDFAQVESDNLRINLTRFSLFFPERRDFFLQSADLFRFGLPRDVEVFFSRRIGIIGREEIPIIGGVRTYGLAGKTNVGLMTMQTGSSGAFASENFSVVRVKQNVLGRSYIGGIFTSRQGNSTFEDMTWGGDFNFRFGVNTLVEGSVARSNRPGSDSGDWFGNVAASQNVDRYDWEVRYTDVGDGFEPGIGFVRRQDQRALNTSAHYKPRPDWRGVRQLSFGLDYQRVEDHDRILETQVFHPAFVATFQTEDILTVGYTDAFDRVPLPFSVGPGVVIPPGEYKQRQVSARFTSNRSRRLSFTASYEQGGFYEGDILGGSLSLQYNPLSQLRLSPALEYDDVRVPGGDVESLIARLYVSYYFSPELTTRAAVQYSSLYEEFVANFRVRWIYTPGSEAWFVYDEGRQFGPLDPSLRDRAVIVKVVHNFHF